MTTNPPWVFHVLGITAGWLMAWHHLRLELSRLVFCQVDSLSLFQLYFLSPLQLFSVFRLLFAFVCAHRDMYRLGFLWSLFRSPDVGVCCWWSTEWAREKPSPEGVHDVGPDSQTQGAFFLSFRILCEVWVMPPGLFFPEALQTGGEGSCDLMEEEAERWKF